MKVSASRSVELFANHFVTYLFEKYKGTRHVRRVASWIGFLLSAMARVAGKSLKQNRERQIVFAYRRRHFKAKYSHKTGPRGGIDIVEILPSRGSPEGKVAIHVKSLADAERTYLSLEKQLDAFIASH